MSQNMQEQVAKLLGYVAAENPGMQMTPDAMAEAARKIMTALNGQAAPASASGKLTAADYPLSEKRKDLVRSASGMGLDDITLDKVTSGQIEFKDVRINPETLEYQAQIAESVGRKALAANLRRAAEMTAIPDEKVLEIYNNLRPYRCSKQELLDIASDLESTYQAKVCAAFVRQAADVYEKNGRLKGMR
jgi:propanediol dehydratase small subunit